MQKIPTQNHEKKTATFFGYINRDDGLEKTNIEWKDLWYQKQRKTAYKIHRQSE